MTHVITQACCNDGICISVCPVQCIHPRPGDPQFASAEQLYIDPSLCIDCGACFDICPAQAIEVDYYLPDEYRPYLRINAEYFERHPIADVTPLPGVVRRLPEGTGPLRVAIVGAGPSGCYAAAILAEIPGIEISMFDRLPTPHGLARSGIAPDHQKTRGIGRYFDTVLALPQVTCFFNVELGRDLTLDELQACHHAVIWSAGATSDRPLGIAGEQLPGCHAAREFVAWYNGHPDHAADHFDLGGRHVVIIGNGNVAIDAARMLVRPVDELDRTDMAHHAISALRASNVREVTLAARRGPADAAYSLPELLALTRLEGVSLVSRPEEVPPRPDDYRRNPLRLEIVEQAARQRSPEPRRINLRYFLSPISINGRTRVESVTFMRNALIEEGGVARLLPTGKTETIETSLVLRAVGYRGEPVPGLPFDDEAGTISNVKGRVVDPETGASVAGFYCAGWIKRGATGVLGTNKRCSAETVDGLLEDFTAGRLSAPTRTGRELAELARRRAPHSLDFAGWARLDAAELKEGRRRRRARSKFVTLEEMLRAAGYGG